jgi:hypothetical protein
MSPNTTHFSEISRRMVSERAFQRAFFAVSALLFAANAAVTIVWCASMSAMGEMPMPAAGRCRWRGCGCPDRPGPVPRRRSLACGS